MTYRPKHLGQYEPVTATSAKDCVATATALLIDRATVSRKRTNHAVVRKASGASSTRGLYLAEAVKAAATFGVTITAEYGLTRNETRDLVVSGRAIGICIDASVTRYTTRRTNYYTGPHMVYVDTYNWWPAGEICGCEKKTAVAHGEFAIDDPGTTSVGYLQWSAELVYRAAASYGGGVGIYCLAAPDTEGRSWKATDTATFRSKPTYSTGIAYGRLTVGKSYTAGRTDNGGIWRRADGTFGNGWVHLNNGTRWAWAKGESVR